MLRLEGAAVRYRGGERIGPLDLAVGPGEVVALVGLNGAGKTTLLRLALGMLRPSAGVVHVLGTPQRALPARCWARVGALIETPPAYPELTARENLHLARTLRRADPAVVEAAITTWGLGPVADRRSRRLSLGTRQRLGLAAALQHRPDLIVLDEPGNALDPASVLLLREQLVERAEAGAAVLVSSHHLDEVARIAHRIELMNAGRLIGTLAPDGEDLERELFERVRRDDAQRGAGVLR